MSTKTTAAQLLAQLRQNAAPIQTTATRTNTKAPISEPDQQTIRQYLAANEPEFMGVFYQMSLETGGRTNDIASMRFENVDFESGVLTYVVAKQTKSAQARAYARGLRQVQQSRMNAALAAGDAVAYMTWGAADKDQIAAACTPEECDRLSYLVSSAPVKRDSKRLSPALLARLKAMKEAAFWDDGFIFSRALTSSNRCRMESGHHITRSTFWARFKSVVARCADMLANAPKLSCYSLRKTAAVQLYLASGKSVAVVMRIFGWSSESMALKYLGLEDEAARVQAAMVRGAA